mgnify:CR=1 FL=1
MSNNEVNYETLYFDDVIYINFIVTAPFRKRASQTFRSVYGSCYEILRQTWYRTLHQSTHNSYPLLHSTDVQYIGTAIQN